MGSREVEIPEDVVSSLVLAAMIMWFGVLNQPWPESEAEGLSG